MRANAEAVATLMSYEDAAGADLAVAVDLFNEWGADSIVNAINGHSDEKRAKVTSRPRTRPRAASCTGPRQGLDTAGLAWINDYVAHHHAAAATLSPAG